MPDYNPEDDYTKALAIVDSLGLTKKITQYINSTFNTRSDMGKYICSILINVLPESFLLENKTHFESMNQNRIVRENTRLRTPEFKSNQSIYHVLPNKRLMNLIRTGNFETKTKGFDEYISTSTLERRLSGPGLYCTHTIISSPARR